MKACLVASIASTAVLVLFAACSTEDERPPVLASGGTGTSPCERIKGLCAASVAACPKGRVSAGSSVGCDGAGAVCCVTGTDGTDASSDASGDVGTGIDASVDVQSDVVDASVDTSTDTQALDAGDAD